MFGFITANPEDLSEEEKRRYKSVYCGLCHAIGVRMGQPARLSLNYDMVFLAIMLSSLYEPEETEGNLKCVHHMVKSRNYTNGIFIDYAADMTVALTYFKCLDDWKDEHKALRKLYGDIIKKSYGGIRERFPRQCGAIELNLDKISEIESKNGSGDEAAAYFGKILGEIFVYSEDIWADYLRLFGDYLGRFIYIMDAAVDMEDDKKKGSYNPLINSGSSLESAEAALTLLIGKAAEIFEKLPLIKDEHIMRSVIYSGVWQQYRQKTNKKDGKQNGTGSL